MTAGFSLVRKIKIDHAFDQQAACQACHENYVVGSAHNLTLYAVPSADQVEVGIGTGLPTDMVLLPCGEVRYKHPTPMKLLSF